MNGTSFQPRASAVFSIGSTHMPTCESPNRTIVRFAFVAPIGQMSCLVPVVCAQHLLGSFQLSALRSPGNGFSPSGSL